ncbi:MAG: hypothetical protein ACK5V3_00465, partial [Bdellovibrionales bacterium]
ALISVNVLKTNLSELDLARIQLDLKSMFGTEVNRWRFLKSFEIPQALPLYLNSMQNEVTPSQQGAFMRAEQLLKNQMNF